MKLNYAKNRIEKPSDGLIKVTQITTLEDVRKQCQKLKNKNERILGLYVVCDNFTDLSFLTRLTEMYVYLKDCGFGGECRIATYPNREYSKEELKNIIKLDGMLAKQFPVADEERTVEVISKEHRANFLYGKAPDVRTYKNVDFDANGVLWSIEEVAFFNRIIDDAVENTRGLSPLETVAYFYTWITDFQYKDLEDYALDELAHTMYGLVSNGYAVCESMANIFELLCSRAGIKCIAVEKEPRSSKEYGHLTNAIYIEDPKYGVKGYYGLDPSNDSLYKKERHQNLAYFMFPLKYSERLYEGEYRDMLMDFSRPQNLFATLENISRRGGLDFIPFKSEEMRHAVQAGLVEHRKLSKTRGLSKNTVAENKRRQKKIERLCRGAIDLEVLFNSPVLDVELIESVVKKTLRNRLNQETHGGGSLELVAVLRKKVQRGKLMMASIYDLVESIDFFIAEDEARAKAKEKNNKNNKNGKEKQKPRTDSGSGKGKKKKAPRLINEENLDGEMDDAVAEEFEG